MKQDKIFVDNIIKFLAGRIRQQPEFVNLLTREILKGTIGDTQKDSSRFIGEGYKTSQKVAETDVEELQKNMHERVLLDKEALARQISIKVFKNNIRENFPDSDLAKLLANEPDLMRLEEFLAKAPIWVSLSEIEKRRRK